MVKSSVGGSAPNKLLQDLKGGFAGARDPKTKLHMGVNFIRAGLALRDQAMAPEEVLVGLGGLVEFPTYKKTDYEKLSVKPDKNLYARYQGKPEPDAPKWDEDRIARSKDLL